MAAADDAAAPPLASTDFQVAYVDWAGVECRGSLDVLWNVDFERAAPVRSFGSFRGQRSFQGLWWLATTGEHIGFESWLERDQLMMLDFDPAIAAVSSQPFWLSWTDEAGVRRHAPDYFARMADGSALVIDVRPDDRVPAEDAAVFAATERACTAVGWRYCRVGAVDALLAANVRWLSGYRHRRCLNPSVGTLLVERLAATPMLLAEAVGSVGERVAVLPTLYHLMWRGVIDADLASAPLSGDTLLICGRRAA